MARQNLSGMTPEERKDHKRKQGNERKRKQRKNEKDEREMAKKKALFTPECPEVVELADGILDLPLTARIPIMAEWQRHYKQKFPLEADGSMRPGETHEACTARRRRNRDLALTRFYADDYFARGKARVRKKKFDEKEADEAARLGITVFELQKRKKIGSWKAEKEASQHSREIDRLARKIAA
ncbi:hypothetical protein [Ensifer sp. ENS01]|uniref:hypothetical protein n=1 Tax=Ensifer sp. ENS01 TaxID=2769293 RepID=UPI001780CFBA|nr:hypothetical protein [Ensifer sp. ENS01]MBD9493188.1 hypothetical protein [Ensifer sp. ENS01]